MYKYHNNILAIEAGVLFNKPMYDEVKALRKKVAQYKKDNNQEAYDVFKLELEVLGNQYKRNKETFVTRYTYDNQLRSKKIQSLTSGGNGRTALIEWLSVPEDIRTRIVALHGEPTKVVKDESFSKYLSFDNDAKFFFDTFRKSDNSGLTESQKNKWTAQANIFNAITLILNENATNKRAFGKGVITLWKNIAIAITQLDAETLNKYPHALGSNWKRLREKYNKYQDQSYASLLHSGIDNDNSKKIKGDNADWILANYMLPNKPLVSMVLVKYNMVAPSKNWPILTEGAIAKWLNKPENKRLWVLARDGREAYNNLFGYHIKRDRATLFPNSWWAIDGTKLDWMHYYDNDLGIAAKLKVDVVLDVASEKIIGWSYSETENMVDHFTALKMAVNTSGARPYLLNYDNQSGHKSKAMQEVYSNVIAKQGGVHYPNKSKRHSNAIEQVFGRLQQQVLNQMWFSDKQSITARKSSSKMNKEFVLENKEHLLTREELEKYWEMCVKLWNEAKHPRFKSMSRNEVYSQEAPMREDFGFMDMVDTFWLNQTRPKIYYKGGMPLEVAGVKFEYEVYDSEGNIDLEFRRKYVGSKFIVKYDPEYLNNFVQLFKEDELGNKTFIANAEPKRAHQQVPVLMKDGDKAAFNKDFAIIDQELQRDLAAIELLEKKTGITRESLREEQENMMKFGGDLPKDIRSKVESELAYVNAL